MTNPYEPEPRQLRVSVTREAMAKLQRLAERIPPEPGPKRGRPAKGRHSTRYLIEVATDMALEYLGEV